MNEYYQSVILYFESEYSDAPIEHVVDQIRVCLRGDGAPPESIPTTVNEVEDSKTQSAFRKKWQRKIRQIIRTYYEAGKPALEAARKLADLLKTYTQERLIEGD